MGPVQDLRTVVDAALLLKQLPQVQFVMIGDGVEHVELVNYAQQQGCEQRAVSWVDGRLPMCSRFIPGPMRCSCT